MLDQPEPQVEIETRIVIAERSFSRDLGVQLAGAVFNSGTGGNIVGGSLPGGVSLPEGVTSVAPSIANSLGVPNASTVIGLTTGLFGTAQISAAISAAEAKGQAKTIANPRVTALNNRPAQIESGQQIPVVTLQPGGAVGGVNTFTTTFVSVPLRLSVTPQINDAGTVVLRVVAENNTVGAVANPFGVPGINTQRMQTEVLVPDGGTTVVGGVLSDTEIENLFRTPGLGSVPVIGNLFRRRQTQRNTGEILFFITPRVYRPDYNGRPTGTNAATGTRSTQIIQPVELGNPSTNTPTPTQLQRQQPSIAPQNLQPPTSINAPNLPAAGAPAATTVPGARPQQQQ